MTFILILFFASLFSIAFMIGRKLIMLQNGQIQILNKEEASAKTPYFEELKYVTVKKLKVAGHKSLVETIRFYIKSSNLLKNKYQDVKMRVKSISKKDIREAEKKEISKFLKVISEYKRKIRKIKEKVKKEENLK
jgi:hypothetical protein